MQHQLLDLMNYCQNVNIAHTCTIVKLEKQLKWSTSTSGYTRMGGKKEKILLHYNNTTKTCHKFLWQIFTWVRRVIMHATDIQCMVCWKTLVGSAEVAASCISGCTLSQVQNNKYVAYKKHGAHYKLPNSLLNCQQQAYIDWKICERIHKHAT